MVNSFLMMVNNWADYTDMLGWWLCKRLDLMISS